MRLPESITTAYNGIGLFYRGRDLAPVLEFPGILLVVG